MRSPIALPSFKWFIVLILGWATPPVWGEIGRASCRERV